MHQMIQRSLRFQGPARPWLLTLAACLAYGVAALLLGQDANWDLRNYHLYGPYAFFNGRLDIDMAPAHVATFYNPLLHLPFYGMVKILPPKAVGFCLGALQGLNIALLLAIGRCCLRLSTPTATFWAAAALAALGLTGAMGISEIGTSYGDNVLSLFVLASLWLIIRAVDCPRAHARVAVAGILAGAAVGLKLPMAAHGVGLAVACLLLPWPWGRRAAALAWFGVGGLVGVALTDGFWLWEMGKRFANPLFPYFNQIFNSPWAAAADYRDPRFLTDTWDKLLLSPLRAAFYDKAMAEVSYREPRLAVVFVLALTAAGVGLARRVGLPVGALQRHWFQPAGRIVFVYAAMAWVVWAKLFGVYRYMVPLEMLLPLVVVLLIDQFGAGPRAKAVAATALLALALVFTRPARWERVPWAEDYTGVQVPILEDAANTIVLIAGQDAVAYVIPAFAPAVRFIRIQGYFTGPAGPPSLYDLKMRESVMGHQGPIYALFRGRWEIRETQQALAAYGLHLQHGRCRPLVTHLDQGLAEPLMLCPVASGP